MSSALITHILESESRSQAQVWHYIMYIRLPTKQNRTDVPVVTKLINPISDLFFTLPIGDLAPCTIMIFDSAHGCCVLDSSSSTFDDALCGSLDVVSMSSSFPVFLADRIRPLVTPFKAPLIRAIARAIAP